MVTKELLEGVRQLQQAGAGPEDIRSILESRGWSKGEIEKVFSYLAQETDPSSGKAEREPKPEADPQPSRAREPAEHVPESAATQDPARQQARRSTAPSELDPVAEDPSPTLLTRKQEEASAVPLAPSSILVNEAFVLMRERFWTLIYTTFVSLVLVFASLFLVHTGLSSLSQSFFEIPLSQFIRLEGIDVSHVRLVMGGTLMLLLAFVAGMFAVFPLASLIGALGNGESTVSALKRGLVRQGALFATLFLLIFFLVIGSSLFVIPALLCLVWFGSAPVISVMERKAGITALAASFRYTHGRFLVVLGRQMLLLVPLVFLLVFFFLLTLPMLSIGDTTALTLPETLYLLGVLVALITALIFFAFFVLGYEVALYRSLRRSTKTSLSTDRVATILSLIAAVSVVIVLAGFVMFPGAFEAIIELTPWY